MDAEHNPKVVIIVSDGPLIVGSPDLLAGRPAIHIPVASPPLRAAALATTIATGMNTLVHGVVTKSTVDIETMTIRETKKSDCGFQYFWDDTDLKVKTINWVAVKGDPKVVNEHSQHPFENAKVCLDADVLGILLPRGGVKQHSPSRVQEEQRELEEFLGGLHRSTHVVILQRRTSEDGALLESLRVYGATFLVDECEFKTNKIPHLELVGGATYMLAGVPCPLGIKQPDWSFLKQFELESVRPFPQQRDTEEVDWTSLVEKITKSRDESCITLLSQRFTTLASLAFRKELWEELEFNSYNLIQLQGKPFEIWLLILALEQQGKVEELQAAIELLEHQYPNTLITAIAKCILQFDPEKSKETLVDIDVHNVGIYHAIGLYGRLCLKVGLDELGSGALKLAIQRGVGTSADRAKLADYLYNREQFQDALIALRTVGSQKGELSWQVLRLRILVALQRTEEIKRQAQFVLEQNPTNEAAKHALESIC